MKKLVLLVGLCLVFTGVSSVLLNIFQKDARAVNPNECPTFLAFDPPEGTDAEDKPLKAYFQPPPTGSPLSFFGSITNNLIDKPPSANVVSLKEESVNGTARWVADFGNIPAGTYFLYLYYNKTGTIADAEECAHFRFWLKRHGSFGDSGGGATGTEGKPTACSADGKEGIETAIGCIPTDISGFVQRLLTILIGIGGGIAFLMIIYGTFKIIGSGGDPDALVDGRNVITAAISGLLLIVFSVFILNLIGIKILQLPVGVFGSLLPTNKVVFAQFAGIEDPTKYSGKDLGALVSDLLPYIFSLAGIVTFLYLLYGGFKYLTASGDPKAVDSARKVITSAIIGLAIIFLSFTIITILGRILGLPFAAAAVYAQGVNIGKAFGVPESLREISGLGAFLSERLLPVVFGLAGIIFFFYLLFGGIKFLTASGDPKAVDSAKRSLTTATVGLLIIFISFWIIVLIGNIFGFKII